jgi:hypothetical protein
MSNRSVIIEEIRAALALDPRIAHAAEVAVAEREGRVTLRGTVRSVHQRRTAVEIAKSARGVRAVEDGLRIDPREPSPDNEIRGAAPHRRRAMDDTIVTVRFTDLGEARRALRMLKLFRSEGQLRVRAAALVERSGAARIGGPDDGAAPRSHADERAVALEEISRDLEPGVTLVIAEVEDPDPDVLDSALDALGGSATQRSAEAFYAEVGVAARR